MKSRSNLERHPTLKKTWIVYDATGQSYRVTKYPFGYGCNVGRTFGRLGDLADYMKSYTK